VAEARAVWGVAAGAVFSACGLMGVVWMQAVNSRLVKGIHAEVFKRKENMTV
jgi:hypothetical protein